MMTCDNGCGDAHQARCKAPWAADGRSGYGNINSRFPHLCVMKISIPVWDLTAGVCVWGGITAHWKQKGACQQYWGVSVFVILWSDRDSFIFLWLHCNESTSYAEVNCKTLSTEKIVLDTCWEPPYVLRLGPSSTGHERPCVLSLNSFPSRLSLLGNMLLLLEESPDAE